MWKPFGKPERITPRPPEGIDERSLQPLFDAIETEEPQLAVDALRALSVAAPDYQSLREAILRGIGKIEARYRRAVPGEPLPVDVLPEDADAERLALLEYLDDVATTVDLSGQEGMYNLESVLQSIVREADRADIEKAKGVLEKRLDQLKKRYAQNAPRIVDFIHKNKKS